MSDVCLSDVCLSRTSGLSQEQRKTKIGTEVPHVTCDSDTTFKVKRSKVKVTRRKAAAAVSVGTYSVWESIGTLRLLGGARRGRRGAEAYCVATRTACYMRVDLQMAAQKSH